MKPPGWIRTVIVVSQFCGTSLWFASNGVMGDLIRYFDLKNDALGHLTASVQFGFITGTLVFALLTITDRFSPSKVFLISAISGAFFNVLTISGGNSLFSLLVLRFFTGFFLAGIYPVGMKIATDYYRKGLDQSLGFLVGALVIGTAFPHLLRDMTHTMPWRLVLMITSGLAIFGGGLVFSLVPDGPFREAGKGIHLTAFLKVFKNPSLRAAAFGYFGHMWELYAFWAFVPVMLTTYNAMHPEWHLNVSFLSFLVIGSGGVACMLAGTISWRLGPKKVAASALFLSGLCCLASPFFLMGGSVLLMIVFLLFWGMVVVADSPLFSTMVAHHASPELRGTALTIVNSIGFSITIISIQLLNMLRFIMSPIFLYVVLAVGPLMGLLALTGSSRRIRNI
jgi:MFS family permease